MAPRRAVRPGDVAGGNIVAGEIHVHATFSEMPASGEEVEFAGHVWLVTKTGMPWPGGRNTYTAILLPPPPPQPRRDVSLGPT